MIKFALQTNTHICQNSMHKKKFKSFVIANKTKKNEKKIHTKQY